MDNTSRILILNSIGGSIMKKDFLWGSSISGGQCEGGFDSRGMTVVDIMPQGKTLRWEKLNNPDEYLDIPDDFYPSRNGTEFYHHYKEDIKLFGEMGFKALRLSILWSRIFPTSNQEIPNEEGLQFYDQVIDECLKYHIQPIITTIHFDMPLWVVQEYDGFRNRKTVDLYETYVRTIVQRYHKRVKHWISFCEINVMNHALYMVGGTVLKPGENLQAVLYQTAHHKLLANATLVKVAHEIDATLQVGCEVAGTPNYPLTSTPEDYFETMKAERLNNRFTDVMVKGKYPYYMYKEMKDTYATIIDPKDLETIKNYTLDFIAVSYYKSAVASVNKEKTDNPCLQKTPFGWTIDPVGFRIMLNTMYERYEIPIMVVENGLGTYDTLEGNKVHDDYRIAYLKEHIKQMLLAIEDGVDIIGYLTWAAIDLVSTSEGQLAKRYGFIYVDRNDDGSGTLQRYPKDSFYWYKKVIASNGNDL